MQHQRNVWTTESKAAFGSKKKSWVYEKCAYFFKICEHLVNSTPPGSKTSVHPSRAPHKQKGGKKKHYTEFPPPTDSSAVTHRDPLFVNVRCNTRLPKSKHGVDLGNPIPSLGSNCPTRIAARRSESLIILWDQTFWMNSITLHRKRRMLCPRALCFGPFERTGLTEPHSKSQNKSPHADDRMPLSIRTL